MCTVVLLVHLLLPYSYILPLVTISVLNVKTESLYWTSSVRHGRYKRQNDPNGFLQRPDDLDRWINLRLKWIEETIIIQSGWQPVCKASFVVLNWCVSSLVWWCVSSLFANLQFPRFWTKLLIYWSESNKWNHFSGIIKKGITAEFYISTFLVLVIRWAVVNGKPDNNRVFSTEVFL